MEFRELEKGKISDIESNINDYWNEIDILKLSIDNREGKKNFVFYDGPATANGMPGIHHVLAKLLKDTFCKYKTMKGFRVVRKVGWDTHGLPVEIEVEKELGLKSKLDIEAYGIEAFNKKCKESVWKNKDSFTELTHKMGQFIDTDNPYITYDNNYIETIWWILKKFFDEGYIYEGYKTLPYCYRCGTGLASHEVALGYQEDTVESVFVTFKKKDEDIYFLVWTTTPWTLISNTALCVHPKEEYVKVESKGYKFILAKKLANTILGDDYTILETYIGKDLEYMEYEQLLPFLKVDKKAFYVTVDNYVSMTDGTGIVHIAPAYGEDDNNIGKRYELPFLNPMGDDGKYTEGPWKDMLVFDADSEVIKYLKEKDLLFKKQKIVHNYPHCWRCSTPLLYYSKPSWYIEMTKLKDKLIENNNAVNWYPTYVGEKRFGNWLENLNDWAISRSRYWGTPFPIWKCSCGEVDAIGSRSELIKRAIEEIDMEIDLHRPFVDDIHIKCPKCNNEMTRVKDVIDCWFDSGAMPFSQYFYPFGDNDLWESQYPADFICEGIDQTRGWFYSLLAISTFVTGKSPYKNVLVNDLLLDKDGQKMSKSKGNSPDPFKIIDEYGADVLRWYLLYVSPVWMPLKFDIIGLKEVQTKFFNTLKNTYTFFQLYANTDNIDPREFVINEKDLSEIDRWLLSKYNSLVRDVTAYMDLYDLNKSVKLITEFVSEDLSNWYIRRNRRRFWKSDTDLDKKSVYKTTHEVLIGITKLIAPIIPFISEEIYRNLTDNTSVHLEDYPICNESLIDIPLEEKMNLVRDLISLGRYQREEVKIKVRQPISKAIIDGKYKRLLGDLSLLINEELNVKEVIFEDNLNKYMNFNVKPNYKEAGVIFGKSIKDFSIYLENISDLELEKLKNNEEVIIKLDKEYTITKNLIDIRISSKGCFNVGMLDNKFIILDTNLTKELIEEGIIREFISKIQQLRKIKDFNIIDRINIYYQSNNEVSNAIDNYINIIKDECLAIEIIKSDNLNESFDINGYKTFINVEKR